MRRRAAFTMIEMMTVIAITAILLTIIIVPIVQSFNFLREGQAFSEAQAKARLITERIQRDIGQAVGVRNADFLVQWTIGSTTGTALGSSMIVPLPGKSGDTAFVALPNAKLDLILPASGKIDPSLPPGVFRDPNTGKIDPTLHSPKGQVNTPLAPGMTIERWFLGLRDPFSPYNDPYDGVLMAFNGRRDNMVVLYRAIVQPYVWRQNKNGAPNSFAMRPNLNFFQSDNSDTQIIDEDDPAFFVADGTPAKAARIQNWLSASIVETEGARYNMISPIYDRQSHQVTYNGDAPAVLTLIQFTPTSVSNEPAASEDALNSGAGVNNAFAVGPDIYRTKYGGWTSAVIRDYPAGYTSGGAHEIAVEDTNQFGYSLGIWNAQTLPDGTDVPGCFQLFDDDYYDQLVAEDALYPFTQAALSADQQDQTNTCAGTSWLEQPTMRSLFTPFDVNSKSGKIVTSFGIDEVGTRPIASIAPQNLPIAFTGPATIPADDSGAGAVWAGAGYQINQAFDRAWNNYSNLQGNLYRFIDLRVTPNLDGTLPPSYPNHIPGTVTGMPRSRIVPGSEIVYGPDERPGPDYDSTVRYVRVASNPGPDEYSINYVDQPEPTNGAGQIDYTMLGLTNGELGGFNPNVYDPTNFVSATIQPRYKAGYIQLDSDPNVPLPVGRFSVYYRFQFTSGQNPFGSQGLQSDAFTVDYNTRQVMQIVLTVLNYSEASNQPYPQTVTLRATAAVRNFIR